MQAKVNIKMALSHKSLLASPPSWTQLAIFAKPFMLVITPIIYIYKQYINFSQNVSTSLKMFRLGEYKTKISIVLASIDGKIANNFKNTCLP